MDGLPVQLTRQNSGGRGIGGHTGAGGCGLGLDVGKGEHFADVLDNDGERLFARAVADGQPDLEALLDRAARHGTPGLVMRRAAGLYPGEAKTDRRDAYVLADSGRTRRKQVHWLDASSDGLLARLRVLNGFDIDLAADATRLASRVRDALTSISPALERAVGERLHQPGVRDLLARYPTLTALRGASQSRIERVVKARSPRIAAKVTAAIAAVLAAQDVTVTGEAATGRVISELAGELDRVAARRDALAGEIEEAFLSHPFGELLASLPGIGPRTGALIRLARRRCDVILAMLRTGQPYQPGRPAPGLPRAA
jgi:Transposase